MKSCAHKSGMDDGSLSDHETGPLDEKSRRLVKLALSVGAGLEGGTHSAAWSALQSGITASNGARGAAGNQYFGITDSLSGHDLDRRHHPQEVARRCFVPRLD